jgi:hypothetical protein
VRIVGRDIRVPLVVLARLAGDVQAAVDNSHFGTWIAQNHLRTWRNAHFASGWRSITNDLTLDYYNRHAEDFWEGTRNHDVSQNIAAMSRYIEAWALSKVRASITHTT